MRPVLAFLLLSLLCVCQLNNANLDPEAEDDVDNDFAEFDDDFVESSYDTETAENADSSKVVGGGGGAGASKEKLEAPKVRAAVESDEEEDGLVENDDEFEHFQDEEEFEGYDAGDTMEPPIDQKEEPKLKIPNIPLHFRTHWDSYWMEMIMVAGLLAYFANFFAGKAKNARLAQLWFSTHKALLDENFALVGDDGKIENENPGLIKESESLYTLWCSGRTCCEGMLVELKMIKRQDLVSLIAGLMRPQLDQAHIKIELTRGLMDSFVFAVGSKKTVTKVFKEYNDLVSKQGFKQTGTGIGENNIYTLSHLQTKFCSLVAKPEDRYNVPSGFGVLSEIPEATSAILESRVITALNKYQSYIDYLHISDQFSGPVQQEEGSTLKQPETKAVLLAGFNLPKHAEMETIKPLLLLIFYLMERLKTYRMSKEVSES